MDQPHEDSDDAPERVRREDGDLLDQTVLPMFGLSAGTLVAIFLGGAVGTLARYLLEAHHPIPAGSLPWPTLLVNLSGSLAIGFLIPLTEHVAPRAPAIRPLVIVGLLGGWTTYSTLAVDATLLAKDGDVVTCLAYLVATVAGGLLLVVLGHAIGRKVVPA